MSESPIVDLRLLTVTHHDLLTFWPERTLQYLETLHLDCRNMNEGAPGTVDENRMVPRPGEWPKVRLMGTY
jgi:hypothetical protein